MLWIRLRLLTVVTLAVALASGGAGVYVLGSQEPAPQGKQPVPKQPANTNGPTPPLRDPNQATDKPATDMPRRPTLREQQLTTRKAKAFYEIARSTRELAEVAGLEYEEVTYPLDLAAVGGEIKLAEIEIRRSEDRLEWARRMFDKGYVSKGQTDSEKLSLKKAQFALEQAQSKRKVLVDYTKSKTINELKSEVQKAHADELAKEGIWNLEKAKETALERELRLNTK